MRLSKTIGIALCAIYVSACGPVYMPNTTPVTAGLKKGDASLMGSAGFGGLDASIAVAPSNRIVAAGLITVIPERMKDSHGRYYSEAMLGINLPWKAEGFSSRIFLGGGAGQSQGYQRGFFDEVDYREAAYFKIYTNIETSFSYDIVTANVGVKLGYLGFSRIDEYLDAGTFYRTYQSQAAIVEPHFTMLFGRKFFQPFGHLGLSLNYPQLFNAEIIPYRFMSLAFGIRCNFGALRKERE